MPRSRESVWHACKSTTNRTGTSPVQLHYHLPDLKNAGSILTQAEDSRSIERNRLIQAIVVEKGEAQTLSTPAANVATNRARTSGRQRDLSATHRIPSSLRLRCARPCVQSPRNPAAP